jgi:hypothetical protein
MPPSVVLNSGGNNTKKKKNNIPKIVATFVYASSQGQRTHSARTNSGHLRLCQQPRAAHALRLDQNCCSEVLIANSDQCHIEYVKIKNKLTSSFLLSALFFVTQKMTIYTQNCNI